MDRNQGATDEVELQAALVALEAASDFVVARLYTDPVWDLVYCHLGMAILAIQACTDEVYPGDPDQGQGRASDAGECMAWVDQAARVLQRVDLGVRPRLAVAVTAVADARAVLREVAA